MLYYILSMKMLSHYRKVLLVIVVLFSLLFITAFAKGVSFDAVITATPAVINPNFQGFGVNIEPWRYAGNNASVLGNIPSDWSLFYDSVIQDAEPKVFRIFIDQRDYETVYGSPNWQSTTMQGLYEILDNAALKYNIETHLVLYRTANPNISGYADWGAQKNIVSTGYPNPCQEQYFSTKAQLDQSVQSFAGLLDYLINKSGNGYGNVITGVSLFNEPFPIGMCVSLNDYRYALAKLRGLLDASGLQGIEIIAPDTRPFIKINVQNPGADIEPALLWSLNNADREADAYNYHIYYQYGAKAPYIPPTNPLTAAIFYVKNLIKQTDKDGLIENLYASEIGAIDAASGNPDRLDDHEQGLVESQLALKLVNGGTDNAIWWMFEDAYESMTGNFVQWGLRKDKLNAFAWRPRFYAASLFMKLISSDASVLRTQSSDKFVDAATFKDNATGAYTIVLVNTGTAKASKTVQVSLPEDILNLQKYVYDRNAYPTQNGFSIQPTGTISTSNKTFTAVVPKESVVVYSNYSPIVQ